MRVVIVSDFGEVAGGAAKVAIASARGLAERGVRVLFLCAVGPVSPCLRHPGIDVRCLDIADVWSHQGRLGAALAGIWNVETAGRLDRLWSQLGDEPTVIHLHQWTKAFSPSVIRSARNSGLPCLISMHDYFLSCPNGIYFLFSHERPCKYRPMSLECVTTNCDSRNYAHKAVRLIRQVAIGRAAWHPKSAAPLDVIHVSEFARSVAAPMLPAGVRHFVVPNPVDVEQRPRVAVDRNRDFVFIGRFTREKQGVLLAAAAAQVGVSATFLGDGPEAAAIRAANPDARVLPWGDAPMVERVLAGARALVFPSIWYETGGLVVAEALARGVPAIVGAATGARDLISDGENGLLCHPGDLTSLSHCLEILDDADTAERMGRTAFETYWKTPLTTAAHVDRLLPVYHTVLEGNGLEHVTGGRR